MTLGSRLIALSAVVFLGVGLGYLFVPGLMLSVVGITSDPQSDFLMRTEGVALVSASAFLWAARRSSEATMRLVLVGLGFYYIVGSIVDLAAFNSGIVGPASVPSAVVRIALGVVGLVAAGRLREDRALPIAAN